LRQGDGTKAVEVLEHAVSLDPSWPIGHALLGRAYQMTGRHEEAKKEFATSQKLAGEERQRFEDAVHSSQPPRPPKKSKRSRN
jgi:Flp pilus assembly protein TadD